MICVLSALVAVGTTQPTHNSPLHDLGQTQYHMQPEHHMSQSEHRMSQEEHHMSQSEHRLSQQEHHTSQPEHHMSEPEHYPSQPQHHIMTQSEHQISQPNHYMSQPQHGYESWSNAEALAHAQSQRTWISPEQPPYQPVEILSQPMIHGQPHIVHSQPLPIDPQLELHTYPYQHPHYPPIGSHHTQDTGLQYPTHGWSMQDSSVYQHPLPEPPAPEHHINSFKEDFPNQSSAFANAVASANSVPVSNHEPANPKLYKIVPIRKADDGADYIMPVADHETRQPRIIHTSNDEGLPDIVQQILAKYRHIPIKIKPEPKPDNAPSPKKRKPEDYGSVHRRNKHKKHKVPTIPVVTKQIAKTKAVAVAKTDTDAKTYTIITGGKRMATKAPLKHIRKHSHKKVLKPLLDPELLAKELRLLSKELWVPPSDKTHEKDIPCDDNPIVTYVRANSDDGDYDDGSDSLDKNKPKDKHHHEKHSDPHVSVTTTPEKDMPEKTTTTSTYIEPDNKKSQKDADTDTDCDSDSLDETTEPCDGGNAPIKEDKRTKNKLKPIINEKQSTNSKPVDPKITKNNDFKEKEVLQRKEIKTILTKEFEAEKKTEQSPKYVPEMKKNNGKQHSKRDQKDADKDNDWASPNSDETTEPCNDENDENKENEGKKHELIPKTDEKPEHDSGKNKPKNTFPHHHDKHSHRHTPINMVLEKDTAKTTTPSLNVKPGDQKGPDNMDSDCDSANSDETTEPSDTENALEKDDKTKQRQHKPKTDKKNIDTKTVNNKGNTDTITDHKLVREKEVKKEMTRKVETKEEKIEQSPKHVPEMKIYNKKQNPKKDEKDADKNNNCVSPSPDETTDSCDEENYPKKENEGSKHEPISKTVEKPKHDSDKNNPKNNFPHHHDEHPYTHTPINLVPEKDRAKTTTPSSNVKPGDQKGPDNMDSDCDSANSDETTEPSDTENALEKGDKTKKRQHKPKTDKKNTDIKTVDNKGNTDTITDHKIVREKEVKKDITRKVETKVEKIEQSPKHVPEMKIYNKNQNPKKTEKNANKNNDWVSPSPDETTDSCDEENYPKKENKGSKHEPISKTVEKPKHDSDKNNPKNNFPHYHNKHSYTHTPINLVPEKDRAKTTTPSSNVKPVNQKGPDNMDSDCDSANSDETTEPSDTENALEKDDKAKKRLHKPKTDTNNTDTKTVDNKRNTATITDHKIMREKEVKQEMTRKVETKEEKIEQSPKHVPEMKIYNKNPIPKKDQKDANKDNDWVSPCPDETLDSCDEENDQKKENGGNKHQPIPKTDKKPKHDSYKNNPKNNSPHHHNKHSHTHTPINLVPEKDRGKTTTPSSNVKPGDEKEADNMDSDCDSANSDETTEPSDTENALEKGDKTKKRQHKPKTDKKNTDTKTVDNKGNTDTITDHKIVREKEVKKEMTRKVETKKQRRVQQFKKIKQRPKPYDENQKPVEHDYNTPVSDECDSTEASIPHSRYDKTPASEYKDKREQSIPHTKKDVTKPQPVNTNKGNKDISNKDKPKDKFTQPQNKKFHPHFPTSTASDKKISKSTTPSTYIKPYDKKDQEDADNDHDCDSASSDENTEPCVMENAPKKADNTINQLPKPKRDEEKYTDTKPVDNKKGNINAKPDHKGVQKKEIKQEVTRKVKTKKVDIVQQSKKTKQLPEPYNGKQKPVEGDYSTPVSDECDSTEGSPTQVPNHKISAPEHEEETKKHLPNAIKDVNKPDTDIRDKDIFIAKKDVKEVEQAKEVTRKVETTKKDKIYQPITNEPESKKYKDKLKPEKQENESSDIEDFHSTESNERQKPLDKTPAPEYKTELKEPLPKGNKDTKDLTKKKKIVDKTEVTVKVETKTKKSKKNVGSSEAVEKSKPVETSNENSDIDDSDSADSETGPKQEKTKIIQEKNDAKKKKTEEVTKKKATKAKNKAEGKATELTSDEVAAILQKTETDQPLSTVGFLISLISHALQGSDSVKQMFEEPKVKTFMNEIIPLFHEKPKEVSFQIMHR